MDIKPYIVVASCSETEPVTIINKLSQCAQINDMSTENNSLFSWNIDTKYYTAAVNIRAIKSNVDAEDLKGNIEAIVIHFDSNKESGLEDLANWSHFINDHKPEIKVLIADSLNVSTKISKGNAINWCLKNDFELIELNPSHNEDDQSTDEDEIIKETKGVERVIEALQTHMWSNLILKSKVNDYNSIENDPINPENTSNIDRMLDSLTLDDDKLEFGDLFQRLHMVKESVQSLSLRERRHCAEQVVAAFWRAIGGDDDEIDDI